MIKVWGRKTSSNVQAVMWSIAELGLPYERYDFGHRYGGVDTAEFLAMNPSGDVPVLIELDGAVYADSHVISEYLDEAYPERSLIGGDSVSRAETRRLVQWFDVKFNLEVTQNLVGEKLMKRLSSQGYPQPAAIRFGLTEVHTHLAYISFLAERRRGARNRRRDQQ